MARFLTYNRSSGEVLALDTSTGIPESIATALVGLELSALWDNRSRNLALVFRGDVYLLALTAANTIIVFQWDGSSWNMVLGPIVAAGGGNLKPVGLEVENESLIAVWHEVGGASPGTYLRASDDGTAWSALPTLLSALVASHGTSVVWRRALFVTSELGIAAFDPDTARVGPYDSGDDIGLGLAETCYGSFCEIDGQLYFVRPDTGAGPQVYKIVDNWSSDTPSLPEWENQGLTIPSLGVFSNTADGCSYALFRSVQDELCLLYSGPLGTSLLSSPDKTTFTPVSLPAAVAALTDSSVAMLEDDRRKTNPQQFLLVRDTVLADSYLLSWDGVNDPVLKAKFTATQFMPPHDHKGDYRIYTGKEPSVEFDPLDPPSEVFPGRMSLPFIVKDTLSRKISISAEWSVDGDTWNVMTEGEGGSGIENLASSPGGESHLFVWDAFNDLDTDTANVRMKIVARISGV